MRIDARNGRHSADSLGTLSAFTDALIEIYLLPDGAMGLDTATSAKRVDSLPVFRAYPLNPHHTHRLCRFRAVRLTPVVVWLLISIASLGRAQNLRSPQKAIKGSLTTTEENPVIGATIELVDPTGYQLGVTTSDDAGKFEIDTNAPAGQYELIVTNSRQLNDEHISLGRADLQIALTVSSLRNSPHVSNYTVSAEQLNIPEKAKQHILLAHERFSKKEIDAAMGEVNAALRIDPDCGEAWAMKALLRVAGRDFEGAIEDATRSIQLDSRSASAYLVLGTAHNSLKQFQTAERELEQALELDPNLWQAQLELAKAWYGEKRFVLSLRELDLIHKDFADVHLVRANLLMSLDRSDEGRQEFEHFLQQAPEDPRAPQVRHLLASVESAPVR